MPQPAPGHRIRVSCRCSNRVSVAVALTDDAVGRIDQIAAACRALGFEHDWILGGVGVFTGSVDREVVGLLRTVPGVLAVETARARWAG
jgi:hypothetical protein